jgi:hypothetical protein
MQYDSSTSLKRVIVTHLSPKKANSFAPPHTAYPLTSQKNGQFTCITKYQCILFINVTKKFPLNFDSNFYPFLGCVLVLCHLPLLLLLHCHPPWPHMDSQCSFSFSFLQGTIHVLVILWVSCFSGCSIWQVVPHCCIFRCQSQRVHIKMTSLICVRRILIVPAFRRPPKRHGICSS